jgi:hypothetical protein
MQHQPSSKQESLYYNLLQGRHAESYCTLRSQARAPVLTHPMLSSCCVHTLDPQCTRVPFLVLPAFVSMLQRLLRLLASYLDAVPGPATEALGYLPHPPSMQTHSCGGCYLLLVTSLLSYEAADSSCTLLVLGLVLLLLQLVSLLLLLRLLRSLQQLVAYSNNQQRPRSVQVALQGRHEFAAVASGTRSRQVARLDMR